MEEDRQAAMLSDRPATDDRLDFAPYRRTLMGIIIESVSPGDIYTGLSSVDWATSSGDLPGDESHVD